MPNYVKSKLYFIGKSDKIDELKRFVKSDFGEFDFNTIIPMPESLHLPESSVTNNAIKYVKLLSEQKLSDEDAMFMEKIKEYCKDNINYPKLDDFINVGKIALDNITKYGAATWYVWSINNWGTKWNACDPFWLDNDILEFDTAWSFPMPVIEVLAKKFPEIRIEFFYADEDAGNNTGYGVFENGVLVDVTYPEIGSDDAYETFNECWGEDLYKNENGKWVRSCDELEDE